MRVSPAVVLASLLFAATGWSDQDPVRPELRLIWADPTSAAIGLRAGVEAEATSILEELGVNVTWEEESSLPTEPGPIRIILLDGKEGRPGVAPHVMGCALKGVSSAAWVYVGAVARALNFDGPPFRWSGSRRLQMMTALGRVVAHELVHVVAPELPHAPHGLLSTRLRSWDLTGHHRPRLDPRSARGFLRGCARRTQQLDLRPAGRIAER
jgi:hypothetical protein